MKIRFNFCLILLIITSFFSCKQTSDENRNARPDENVETLDSINLLNENYIIRPYGILNIKIGDSFDGHENNLKPHLLKTGEGNFQAYKIYTTRGTEVGFAIPSPNDKFKIGSIEVNNAEFKTLKGIGVGSTYDELKRAYPNIQTHGSEVESRTISYIDGLSFILDAYFNTYDIDKKLIRPNTKIKSVIISGLPKLAAIKP